jgi:hypothetical protein
MNPCTMMKKTTTTTVVNMHETTLYEDNMQGNRHNRIVECVVGPRASSLVDLAKKHASPLPSPRAVIFRAGSS